jgi:pyruvate dehydrogenase E2 component (dihydrolipoamide acetyltransferase)
MSIEIKMPALSPTMEEGTLARWLVKEGDTVQSGDLLAEIETDKATMEFEAVDEGVIADRRACEGTDGVKVGTVIAMMAGEGEAPAPVAKAAPEPSPPLSKSAASRLSKHLCLPQRPCDKLSYRTRAHRATGSRPRLSHAALRRGTSISLTLDRHRAQWPDRESGCRGCIAKNREC